MRANHEQCDIAAALTTCSEFRDHFLVRLSDDSGVGSRAPYRAAGSLGVHSKGCAARALHVYQLGAAPARTQGVQGLPSAAACPVSTQPGARRAAAA